MARIILHRKEKTMVRLVCKEKHEKNFMLQEDKEIGNNFKLLDIRLADLVGPIKAMG